MNGNDARAVTQTDVRLPARPRESHKGNYGRLLIIGGSIGYTGAPVLAANAAVRSGAGLVHIGVPSRIYNITAMQSREAMPFPLPCDESGKLVMGSLPEIQTTLERCDVCVLGPGLGRSGALDALVHAIVKTAKIPLVLDADALNALSGGLDVIKRASSPAVLTPHEGEFLRLGGDLSGGRVSGARSFALRHGCVLVLKGHRTVTAFPDGEVCVNTTGNPGMAKGGSGDVLSGMIGALMGQLPPREAVTYAVWLHGRAGDVCAQRLGEYSMTPSDIIEALPGVFSSCTNL